MSYSLKLDEERVTQFIRNYAGLSRQGRIRLFTNLHADLGENGDLYRNDPDRRLGPGSTYFWYYLLLRDDQGDGRARQFSFIVDDSAAIYGVLQVEYLQVNEETV